MSVIDRIPVRLVIQPDELAVLDAATAFVRLPANSGHGHPDGQHCTVCAMQTDVRAILFDLLEGARQGLRPRFSQVVIDASDVTDKARIIAALTGKLPAQALRDHTVARRFYLAGQS